VVFTQCTATRPVRARYKTWLAQARDMKGQGCLQDSRNYYLSLYLETTGTRLPQSY